MEEILLILQESQCYFLLELVDAVPRWMFSGPDLLQVFDSSICDWKNKLSFFKGDHAPDCGVAQGVVHGVVGHHGKKQEEVEEELEQEVERQEEENAQTPVRMTMTMDEMERH